MKKKKRKIPSYFQVLVVIQKFGCDTTLAPLTLTPCEFSFKSLSQGLSWSSGRVIVRTNFFSEFDLYIYFNRYLLNHCI